MSLVVRAVANFSSKAVATFQNPRRIWFCEKTTQEPVKGDLATDALQIHAFSSCRCGESILQRPPKRCRRRICLRLQARSPSNDVRSHTGISVRGRADADLPSVHLEKGGGILGARGFENSC